MTRARILIVALILAAVGAASWGSTGTAWAGRPDQSPRQLQEQLMQWELYGQYGRLWQILDPRQRSHIHRTIWEECKRKLDAENPGVDFLSLKAIDSYPDIVTLPPIGRIHVEAVTAQTTFKYLGQKHTISSTKYWTRLGGRWYGLYDSARYRAFAAGRCP